MKVVGSSLERDLLGQIQRYRIRILYKAVEVVDALQDEKLNFPVEDQSEYEKGYDQALCDIRAGIQNLYL